jgi:hypothetical protein
MAPGIKIASAEGWARPHSRFAGNYSIRFGGFGLGLQGEAFHIVGVGQLRLEVSGALSGSQHSSVCSITAGSTGAPPFFLYETFQLEGKYAIHADGTGTVSIDFVQKGTIKEKDIFRVVPGDNAMTRFWLISTKPTVGSKVVPELVSGEAIRLY